MWIFKIFSGGNTPGPPLKGEERGQGSGRTVVGEGREGKRGRGWGRV